jgi:ribosome-dependent ATPase
VRAVIVSTAYMDEAQQFEWTCAMYGGKVIAAGKTPEILQKTGEKTLEAAFIDLLPEEKRAEHRPVVVRPRTSDDSGPPVIEADGLTQRFGNTRALVIRLARVRLEIIVADAPLFSAPTFGRRTRTDSIQR